jgi:hypothetical protein
MIATELAYAIYEIPQLSRDPEDLLGLLPAIKLIAEADLGELEAIVREVVSPGIDGHCMLVDLLQAVVHATMQLAGAEATRQ